MTKTVLCGVSGIISELREVDSIDQPNGRSTEEMCQWLEFPEGTLSYCTCAQEAVSTKRRKKFGSSVAYKTIGTFLSKVRREDASRLATEQAKFSKGAAVRH